MTTSDVAFLSIYGTDEMHYELSYARSSVVPNGEAVIPEPLEGEQMPLFSDVFADSILVRQKLRDGATRLPYDGIPPLQEAKNDDSPESEPIETEDTVEQLEEVQIEPYEFQEPEPADPTPQAEPHDLLPEAQEPEEATEPVEPESEAAVEPSQLEDTELSEVIEPAVPEDDEPPVGDESPAPAPAAGDMGMEPADLVAVASILADDPIVLGDKQTDSDPETEQDDNGNDGQASAEPNDESKREDESSDSNSVASEHEEEREEIAEPPAAPTGTAVAACTQTTPPASPTPSTFSIAQSTSSPTRDTPFHHPLRPRTPASELCSPNLTGMSRPSRRELRDKPSTPDIHRLPQAMRTTPRAAERRMPVASPVQVPVTAMSPPEMSYELSHSRAGSSVSDIPEIPRTRSRPVTPKRAIMPDMVVPMISIPAQSQSLSSQAIDHTDPFSRPGYYPSAAPNVGEAIAKMNALASGPSPMASPAGSEPPEPGLSVGTKWEQAEATLSRAPSNSRVEVLRPPSRPRSHKEAIRAAREAVEKAMEGQRRLASFSNRSSAVTSPRAPPTFPQSPRESGLVFSTGGAPGPATPSVGPVGLGRARESGPPRQRGQPQATPALMMFDSQPAERPVDPGM
ncbi:DNA repair protein [Carpediemonas membranifera]|uniref:DNA repair protein n=1 Tax=Carpediemonas membranifera TaxID=201153 RepID=A0A8J6BFF4_9EUKA|nr:DNA repair protein [Carpediemonas membranifera]|eukprot:KAG9396342.1 DNA repair protein [Carpediemonas membranifera]